MKRGILALIRLYRLFSGAVSPGRCRFIPTCSAYALEAVEVHGAVRGSALAARRICRCHPWGGLGVDPVPAKNVRSSASPDYLIEA